MSLFHLFIEAVSLPSEVPSLSSRGVENLGFSCMLSTLLEEFAFCREHYEFFLLGALEQKTAEEDGHFALRRKLQQLLQGAVFKLQGDLLVSKKEVKEILEALADLASYWNFFTCDLLRNLFVFYPKDSVGLYSQIMRFMEGVEFAHFGRESFTSCEKLKSDKKILSRIRVSLGIAYPEKMEEKGMAFNCLLKCDHIY